MLNCPVCGQEMPDSEKLCSRCGFNELHKEIANRDEEIQWLKETVVPHGIKYVLSEMMPTEARRVRLVLGLEDGIVHSDEEVAKIYDVCVNRIYQHKASFLRVFRRLPCTKKLQELQND